MALFEYGTKCIESHVPVIISCSVKHSTAVCLTNSWTVMHCVCSTPCVGVCGFTAHRYSFSKLPLSCRGGPPCVPCQHRTEKAFNHEQSQRSLLRANSWPLQRFWVLGFASAKTRGTTG